MDEQIEKLHNIYYNPKTGFIGLNGLINRSKDANLKLSNKQIKEWYKNQPVNQIYSQKNTNVEIYDKIQPILPQPGTMQMDLMDISRFSKQNSNYKFLLNIIDVYSRYAWSIPLKKKTPDEIAPHIEIILKLLKKPIAFTFDQGSEFKGAVNKLFEKYDVQVYLNDPGAINAKNKVGMIERLNRTLWNRIKKYMQTQQTLKFIDVLQDIVNNYNNTRHSAILQKPEDVFLDKKQPIISIDKIYLSGQQDKFTIGNLVRFKRVRKTFDKKAFEPIFSISVHRVVGKSGHQYELDNGKFYYDNQLINATEQKDDTEYQKQILQNDKSNKIERGNLKEFGIKDTSQFILPERQKRVIIPRKRLIEE